MTHSLIDVQINFIFCPRIFFVFFAVKAHLADENDIHQLSVLLLYYIFLIISIYHGL